MRPMRSIGLYIFVALYCALTLILLYLGRSLASFACIACAFVAALLCVRPARGSMHAAVALALCGIALAVARLSLVPSELSPAFSALLDRPAALEGTVIAIPDLRETSQKITIDIAREGEHTHALATVPLYPPVHAGDRIRLSGTFKKPSPFETDGGRSFAYDRYLQAGGIYAVMPSAHAEVIGTSKSAWLHFLRMLEWLKDRLSEALDRALPEPESALAVGILVGGKQGLGQRLIDDFTASGMLQIIVLSGFNVMIVASTLMAFLKRLPKKVSFAAAMTSIASFVLMSGAGSSAIRAGLMAGFAIAARTYGRRYDVLRIVCITLFLIALWNPLTLAYDPGFQFSFIATLGLVIGTPLISPFLLFLRSTALIEMFSTTLAAEISLLPLLLYETGNLSFVSILANVLAMPVIPFAMAASALAAALALPLEHLSPVLPIIIGLPAYAPLWYVIHVATLSASLPFANRILPAFPFWLVLASYAALAFVMRLSSRACARPPRPGNGSPPRPSSGSRRRHRYTTSSPTACNPPYTHAPTGR